MDLYEFITPSDCITFYAPDDDIATAVTIFIGGAKAGCRSIRDDRSLGTIFFGDIPTEIIAKFKDTMDKRSDEVAAAAHTFAVCSPDMREEYDKLTNSGGAADEVRRWEDRHRSSMTDWCTYARGLNRKEPL